MTTPKYLPAVLKIGRTLAKEPGVHHVSVFHDTWCDLLGGRGPCNCDPDVREGLPPRQK